MFIGAYRQYVLAEVKAKRLLGNMMERIRDGSSIIISQGDASVDMSGIADSVQSRVFLCRRIR